MKALHLSRYLMIACAMLTVTALAACSAPSATPVATVSANQPTAVIVATTVVQPTATRPAPTATALPPTVVAPTVAPTRAQPTAASSGSALDAIIKAGRAQLAAKAWRSNITTEVGGTTLKNIVEFVAPDRFHIAGDTEMLIIGDKTYIKQGATWMLFPADMSALIAQYTNAAMITEMEQAISEANLVGPDTLDGKRMLVYSYKSVYVISGLPINSMVKMWVSTTDGLPYKQEVEGEISGVKSKTINLIEYPTDLKIEAPVL